MTARIKTHMLVSSAMRLAEQAHIAVAILHRGDPDAGAILLEIERNFHEAKLLGRATAFDGGYEWVTLSGEGFVRPADVSAMIERERQRDPDCWVISVQDQAGRNIFEMLDSHS